MEWVLVDDRMNASAESLQTVQTTLAGCSKFSSKVNNIYLVYEHTELHYYLRPVKFLNKLL